MTSRATGPAIPSGPATPPAATQRSILLLSFATFSSMAAQRVCDAMLPELARQYGVGLAQAAQVVSVLAIVYGVMQLFYGPLGDRLGKFRVIAWATLGCSLGNVLACFSDSLQMLVLSRALVGFSAAAIIPLALAWLGDVAEPARLQETIARVGLGTTLGIGGGQLVGGILTDTLGWRWAFGVLAVLFCVVGSLLLADARAQRSTQRPVAAAAASPRRPYAAQLRSVLAGSWTRTILLVGVLQGAAGFGALAIWASHLHSVMGFSLSGAGAVVALFGLGGVLYMAVARHLIRRFAQHRMAPMGVGVMFLATLVVAFTPWPWLTLPASVVGGFGFFAFHNVMQANAAQMAPAARGTAVSLFAASMFLGQSVGVQLAAGAVERLGSGTVIALAGAVMLVLALFFSRALRQRDVSLLRR